MCLDQHFLRCLRPVVVLAAVFFTSTAPPALAQRVAYRISGGPVPQFGTLDLATGDSAPATADEAQIDATFTADGQYAVTSVSGGVVARHMPSRSVISISADFRPVVAHPRRLMLFGYTGVFELARLDVRGVVRWTPCPGVTTVSTFDVTPDGRHLFVACMAGEVVVLDTESGTEVRRITGLPATIRLLLVNAAGTELVTFRSSAGFTELERRDAQTGQLVASRAAWPSVARTGSRRQLMEFNCTVSPGSPCRYQLVETASLAVSLPLPGAAPFFARVFVSPDGRHAIFNDVGFAYAASRAVRLDIGTGQTLNAAVMEPGQSITVNYVPVPMAPATPSAVVAGSAVTLSWELPAESPQATGYQLDIGTAPGATNLGSIPVGPSETFSTAGVPPGRYYVRVRAVNYTGTSAPSPELVVTVP